MSLADIESVVPTLTQAELAHLEAVLRAERQHREVAKSRTLNFDDLSGSLVLTEDPLWWQRRQRDEWA